VITREDGTCFPINCESNRRKVAFVYRKRGELEMTATMCGFLFLYSALEPGSEAQGKAERVAVKLQGSYGNSMGSCRAAAMRIQAEQPKLFQRLASERDDPFVSHEWPAENLDN
jgi:hypothetical protein